MDRSKGRRRYAPRPFALGAVIVAALALGWFALAVVRQPAARDPVYDLSALDHGLLRHIRPGQTIRVRGFLTVYVGSVTISRHRIFKRTAELTDTRLIGIGTREIDVALGPATLVDSILNAVRGIPRLGAFVPATVAHPLTGRLAVYRLTFVGCPTSTPCGQPPPWRLVSGG